MMEVRSFTLPLRCNYLLHAPEKPSHDALLVVALHGHAMTPLEMLRLSTPLAGDEHYMAALQGPYQLWSDPVNGGERRVVFHWGTSFEPEHSRRLHHEMVLHVQRELSFPPERTVLLGFSQSVSYNYRFAGTHPERVAGVIGICGGLPGDWDDAHYKSTDAAALHIATRQDQWYKPEVTGTYAERLRPRYRTVEFHLLEGGHRIPSAARPLVRSWLAAL